MTKIEEWIEILNKRKIIKENGCWDLDLSATEKGYLRIKLNGDMHYVHRISAAFYLKLDYDNKEQLALHKNDCHNTRCWNPDHLYVGNASDNFEDIIKLNPNHPFITKKNKTYCINGHEFTKENTRLSGKGNRYKQCKICAKLNQRRYRIEKANNS